MEFDWRKYLDLAKNLKAAGVESSGKPEKEEFLRSSSSRAYYAAYCYTRNVARASMGFTVMNKGDDHNRLVEFLRKTKPDIAKKLGDVRSWRNQCDYDDTVNNLSLIATSSIANAEAIFKGI